MTSVLIEVIAGNMFKEDFLIGYKKCLHRYLRRLKGIQEWTYRVYIGL
jgi:hypothetical protein